MFSKLGVAPASLHQVFLQKVRVLLKVCCPKLELEAEQRLVCLQTAFLWLCSSLSSSNKAPWAAYDPLYPHSFPEKKKRTARSLHSDRAVSCSCRNAQLGAFLLGCLVFHPDRLLWLPSPFSELQPRLPERLQAPVAGCHPCFWSAGSFSNTLWGIQEDPDPRDLECEEPVTDPHLVQQLISPSVTCFFPFCLSLCSHVTHFFSFHLSSC